MEHLTAGTGEPLQLAPHVLDVELTAKQVDPQIPVRLDPKVTLAEGDEEIGRAHV